MKNEKQNCEKQILIHDNSLQKKKKNHLSYFCKISMIPK